MPPHMGRGDSRNSPKMRRLKRQRKLKERRKRRVEAGKAAAKTAKGKK
jgi:hypothetical protein